MPGNGSVGSVNKLGWSQYHLAVAGGYEVQRTISRTFRTHPLPRGGTDSIQLSTLTNHFRQNRCVNVSS